MALSREVKEAYRRIKIERALVLKREDEEERRKLVELKALLIQSDGRFGRGRRHKDK